MQNNSPGLDAAHRVLQRSKPKLGSWLGLILFVGSLLLAVEIRGAIVDQMQYREFEPIPIATLDAILLGISAVLVVASSIFAWRIWWTIILIGTTVSGLPDPAAPIASGVTKFVARLRSALSYCAKGLAQYDKAALATWRGLIIMSVRGQRVLSVMAAASRPVLKALTDAVTSGWLLLTAVTVYLGKRLAWASNQSWTAILTVASACGHGLIIAVRPARTATAVVFHQLARSVVIAVGVLWLILGVLSTRLVMISAWASKTLWTAISWLAGRVGWMLAACGRTLGTAIVVVFNHLTRAGAYVVTTLWRVSAVAFTRLFMGLAWASKTLWVAVSCVVGRVSRMLATCGRTLGTAIAFVFSRVARTVAFTVAVLWRISAFALTRLFMGLALVSKTLWAAVSRVAVGLGRVLAICGQTLGTAIVFVFSRVTRTVAFTVALLWRVSAFALLRLVVSVAWAFKTLWTPALWLMAGLGHLTVVAYRAVDIGLRIIFRYVALTVTVIARIVWMVVSISASFIGAHLISATTTFWTVVSWLAARFIRLLAISGGVAGVVIASFYRILTKSMLITGRALWMVVFTGTRQLGRGLAWASIALWAPLSRFGVFLGLRLAAMCRPVGNAVLAIFRNLASSLCMFSRTGWFVTTTAVIYVGKSLLSRFRHLRFSLRRVWLVPFRRWVKGINATRASLAIRARNYAEHKRRFLLVAPLALSIIYRDFRAAVGSSISSSIQLIGAGFRYVKNNLLSALLKLAIGTGMLVLFPFVLLRVIVDRTFRRNQIARIKAVAMFLKARPAVGLSCFAVIVVAGFGIFTELGPDPTVTVLIWSSPETETVIRPALDIFNTNGYTVAVNGGNYRVRARSVTVESSEIHSKMVAALNTGKGSVSSTEGPPTVVSPSTSSWLSQINLDTGRQVFRMDNIRPIARTPVIIVTYRGMAECLGWPDNPVSWSDLIELAESVQGWSACPTARPEWGVKPLVVLREPEVNSTARSTLQILNVVASGKPAKELTVGDVESLEVREFVHRFEGIVDHFYSDVGDIRRQLHEGPSTVHFALVEERHIPKIYFGRPSDDPSPELVAIYPSDGTIWHDNPFAMPDAPWVTTEQREAARVVRDYLRGENVQRQFMEDGFRAGVYKSLRETLTPSRGLDLEQPNVYLGRVSPEVAKAIQRSWNVDEKR